MTAPDIYGLLGPVEVHAVTLSNGNGLRARVITYGARLTELHVPDRAGVLADIVLGHDTLAEYVAGETYFGATCGRYANRIADGRVRLDGIEHQLDRNEQVNHLHGGRAGFDRKVWTIDRLTGDSVVMTATSDAGEMGYPGRCQLRTTYALTEDDRLLIVMEADTSATTLMNMVNHSYFNLAGQGSGTVLGQHMRMFSRFYTPVDADLLATGEIRSVAGTPFDFSTAKPIGQDMAARQGGGAGVLSGGSGYDHNWCLDSADTLHPCAEVFDPGSGRRMMLATTEPGVQFYTGGYLSDRLTGKAGLPLCQFAGFTLETQKFPGSPGFGHFPQAVLRPGETYCHRMAFRFSTKGDA